MSGFEPRNDGRLDPVDGAPEAAALVAFVRAHQAAVWRYLRVLGCEPDDADDLTQDTFVAVLSRSVHDLPSDRARSYVLTTARNELRKAMRRARLRCAVIGRLRGKPFHATSAIEIETTTFGTNPLRGTSA